jgi:hypothetical protein
MVNWWVARLKWGSLSRNVAAIVDSVGDARVFVRAVFFNGASQYLFKLPIQAVTPPSYAFPLLDRRAVKLYGVAVAQ